MILWITRIFSNYLMKNCTTTTIDTINTTLAINYNLLFK